MRNFSSVVEGNTAEQKFINLRGDKIVRKATKEEDIKQHWDVLDSEYGRIDVKAQKRLSRSSSVQNDYHWYELKTVKRPPKWESGKGWGIPNEVPRLIAFELQDRFILVNPEDVIDDLRDRCKELGRGEFLLYRREGRGDLMTMLPVWYLEQNSTAVINKESETEF